MSAAQHEKKRRFTVPEWSWILYDWANSVYATNIMAAIFPPIFVAIAGGTGSQGDIWWGYGVSIATFIAALLAPLLGAAADFRGVKKKLFTVFMLIGVVFTFLIAMVMDSWKLMLIGYIFSRIGFSASCLFYDSFLTDVTTDERMDMVSSWGYSMGYIGGSTIPFVISIAVLLALGYENPIAQKFSIIITSVWWLVFSIPFLKNVEQTHGIERSKEHTIRQTFRNIGRTAREIIRNRGLFLYVMAYFFYIDGVGTIINISTAYGSALGLGSIGMILALMVMQLVAMPCTIWFARLAEKITARKALIAAIAIYIVICCVGFFMGFSLEPHQEAYENAVKADFTDALSDLTDENAIALRNTAAQYFSDSAAKDKLDAYIAEHALSAQDSPEVQRMMEAFALFLGKNVNTISRYQDAVSLSTALFWAMAVLVGTVQGGIQAVSRSYFGKLIPKERSNEFFGFFDIFGKFASVLGPFLYALLGGWTGRSSYGVLALAILFLVGLTLMSLGKKQLDALTEKNA